MAAKLDRNKPHGEVYGFASHRFEQDGRKFDAAGNEVTEKNTKPPRPQSTATKADAEPSGEQLDAQLKG